MLFIVPNATVAPAEYTTKRQVYTSWAPLQTSMSAFRGEMAKKRKKASREFRCLPKILHKQDPENADEEPRPSYRPYELVMEKALEEFKGHVTLQYIKEMFSKDLNVNVSKKTVSKFLHQVLGYNYCRADAVVRKLTPERLARIRRFLIEYADALQKELSDDEEEEDE